MTTGSGRAPSGQALVASDEARSDLHPSGFDPSRGFMLKPFVVEVQGFGAFAYPAASRGKARAEAWRDYLGCHGESSFKDFLRISRVWASSNPGDRFGEPILVCNKPAFYVGMRGQYVRFVRPGETLTHLSHPADVRAASGTEARRAETGNTGSVHDGPTAASGDAQP